ncbi:unnamed protein product [Lepeophtheirus salmonis]|uniref:(salmon louse) hypothetical protein n=1 Tax=Lepeophtheirus salmonis TaxID=72036 RepID=A0A7R8H4B6_LEPSM|nr:unnamed protein product [Lepeophtheirus salmonis]CAF2847147.1 unnamed protein product [Lepeophtheirus salmonis]
MVDIEKTAEDASSAIGNFASGALDVISDSAEDMIEDIVASATTLLPSLDENGINISNSNNSLFTTLATQCTKQIIMSEVIDVGATSTNSVAIAACTTRVRSTGYYLLINLSIRDILLAGLSFDSFTTASSFSSLSRSFFSPSISLLRIASGTFAGEEGYVPRPWTHSIYITLIWFFSVLFAVPTAFFSEVRDEADDFYGNDISGRPTEAKACLHRVVPWFALLVQICSCCTRKLNKSELWLSVITLLLIILWEISRAPLKLFNIHHILTSWEITKLTPFLPPVNTEIYRALMKWAIYAPAAIHPLIYFAFSPEVRHGAYILFSRCCSCCCSSSSKSGGSEDGEIASDDEKGRMLPEDSPKAGNNGPTTPTVNTVPTVTTTTETIGTTDSDAVPLQSKQEDEM